MRLTPIRPQKVYVEAANQIRALIESGHFRPGDRLPPERELARQLAISRPSLREALSALQALGLIRTRRGGGVYVAEGDSDGRSAVLLSAEDSPLELLEARQLLEPQVAALAATRRTAEDLAELERLLRELAGELAEGRHSVARAVAFHLAIARAAHNATLLRAMRAVAERLSSPAWHAVKERELSGPPRARRYHAEHERIYQAILRGSARAAAREMRAHLASLQADLLGGQASAPTEAADGQPADLTAMVED